MNLSNLPFKKKNRFLWIGTILLLIVCWFFSFSKTITAYKEHRQLSRVHTGDINQQDDYYQINRKYNMLDSLVHKISVDTVVFENNFLQQVSLALEGLPVSLSYDGSKRTTQVEDGIVAKEITLQGKYTAIVHAVKRLEDVYFVSSIQYNKAGYLIRLRGVKGR